LCTMLLMGDFESVCEKVQLMSYANKMFLPKVSISFSEATMGYFALGSIRAC